MEVEETHTDSGVEKSKDLLHILPHMDIELEQDEEHTKSSVLVPELKCGSRFSDPETLMRAVEKYSLDNNYVFTTVKSKSIASIYNKIIARPRREYSTKLKWCYILFGCKHYGRCRSAGRGIRPNQKSFKSNCPAFIEVKADHDAEELYVSRLVDQHNHETGPEMAQFYPERRRLTTTELNLFREQLSSCDVNPSLLQDYVRSTTRKAVSTKDIYNLKQRLRAPEKVKVTKVVAPTVVRVVCPKVRVVCPKVSKVEPAEVEVCEEDHAYASEVGGDEQAWSETEYIPDFLDEREVAFEEDEGNGGGGRENDVLQVEKVNEAWKCVYMVLEDENKGLKAENKRLNEEVKKLRADAAAADASAAAKKKNVACFMCSKAILSKLNARSAEKAIKSKTSAAVDQLLRSVVAEQPQTEGVADNAVMAHSEG